MAKYSHLMLLGLASQEINKKNILRDVAILVRLLITDLPFKGQCEVNINKLRAFRRKAIVPSGPMWGVFSHTISVGSTPSRCCLSV